MILNQYPNRRPRKGNVLALVALSLPFLIGLAALALDGGLLMDDHRVVQAAADAAALAGATGLYKGNTQAQAQTSGKTTALAILKSYYGISTLNDGTTNVVTVTASPGNFQGGSSQGSAIPSGEAEAIVTYNRPRAFSRIWSSATIAVTARAVAHGVSTTGIGLLVLAPSGSNALTTSNSANITVTGGNIVVDSTDSKAATSTNTGVVSTNKSLILTGSPGYNPTTLFSAGTILTGQTATADPLSSMASPTKPATTFGNVDLSQLPGSTSYGSTTGNTFTFTPGRYGHINISDNNTSDTYAFSAGTYWFDGGGLTLSGNANITGSGVLLYFDNGGAMSITAGGSVTLSPQTTGTYAGITVFQNKTNNSQDSITGQSTGSLNISGTFYAPDAKLSITGSGGNYALGSEYIVNQLSVTGSGNFNITTSSSSATTIIGLIE